MRKLIHISLLFFTMLSALALLLAYLSIYINPKTFWFLGMIGLAYPALLLANVAFLVYWVVRWKWNFMIPLLAIVMGIAHFSSFFQFPYGKKIDPKTTDIRVLTYNVNLFQLYSWAKKPPTHTDIFSFIKEQDADIISLQEFYVINDKFTEQQAMNALEGYNVHISYIVKRSNSAYGIATYSRHPIIYKGEIKFENSANACIYTDVVIGNDTVRVYNSHLQSLRLNEKNLNFLLDQNYRKEAQTMNEIKDISFRYRDALQKRALQVEIFTNHILSSPYPVIVSGDFNDSPISYNYQQMRKNLNDAFVEAGSGVGYTYKGFFPAFRIDYILYNKVFTATSYESPKVYFSDHYPVVSTLRKSSEE